MKKNSFVIVFCMMLTVLICNIEDHVYALTDPYDCYWSYVFRTPKIAKRISQRYSSGHYGIDIVHATPGEINNDYPIYNVGYGSVIASGWNDSMGNYTVVAVADGYTTRSLHMKTAPYKHSGDIVYSSSVLGLVGNTGDSYGSHLHFDVNTVGAIWGGTGSGRVNYSTTIDPEEFFSAIDFSY